MRRTLVVCLCLAGCALVGCAKGRPAKQAELTERQRDSILATEPLPGAGTVGRALEASDRAADHAAQTQAAVDSLAP